MTGPEFCDQPAAAAGRRPMETLIVELAARTGRPLWAVTWITMSANGGKSRKDRTPPCAS